MAKEDVKGNLETTNLDTRSDKIILTIEPAVAQSYVDNWQTGEYQIVPSTVTPTQGQLQLNSFSFSLDDFTFLVNRVNAYNENNPDNPIGGVICRIGVKDPTGENPVPHMSFEPLLGGNPGIPIAEILPLNELGTQSACYDVSYPCPPTCPNPGS